MLANYKNKTNLYVGLYILINIGTFIAILMGLPFIVTGDQISPLVSILQIISFGCLLFGLYFYAKAKGYSGWLSLLGFLQILGLIILVVLPDKNKITKEKS